ncbi:MAG: arginyltransferase [Chloroflexi bacterium]|nr:arginyltransferase [Chloroflexota bacterium]
MRVIRQLTTRPGPCSYLPEQTSALEYTVVSRLDPQEYEDLMNRGYRKFGPALFRPVCDLCQECRPIRIPLDRFRPDRSQRRAWKQNNSLEVKVATPTADARRTALYHRYHKAQTDRKGWASSERKASEYAFQFVANPIPGAEISMWEGDALRAVVIADLTPTVISGVYHYYDPDCAQRSIGTYCMLQTIDLGRRLGKEWAYFGFFVSGCGSLEYKARFRPCEIMQPDGTWAPHE